MSPDNDMNALKRILSKQTWIQELKQMKLAVKAVELYAAKYTRLPAMQASEAAALTPAAWLAARQGRTLRQVA